MSELFMDKKSFNEDISKWDVSSVTNMLSMFAGVTSFRQDISTKEVTRSDGSKYIAWDVGKVENMHKMFYGAELFNQDISNWNVSKVEDMSGMFYGAKFFYQNISKWDVSRVEDMTEMFAGATSFDQKLEWGLKLKKDVNKKNMFKNSGGSIVFMYKSNLCKYQPEICKDLEKLSDNQKNIFCNQDTYKNCTRICHGINKCIKPSRSFENCIDKEVLVGKMFHIKNFLIQIL